MYDNFNTRGKLSLNEKSKIMKIRLFRKFINYQTRDLYIKNYSTLNGSEFDILVKIGKSYDFDTGYGDPYKSSLFMSLKSGELHYDLIEDLSSYMSRNPAIFTTYNDALAYCEEITKEDNLKNQVSRLFEKLTLSKNDKELEQNLFKLKTELTKEQIENYVVRKLLDTAKEICLRYYTDLIKRNFPVYHQEDFENYLKGSTMLIKFKIKIFELLKRLVSENDKILKEDFISHGSDDILEYLYLVEIINSNLDYITQFENYLEAGLEDSMAMKKLEKMYYGIY